MRRECWRYDGRAFGAPLIAVARTGGSDFHRGSKNKEKPTA